MTSNQVHAVDEILPTSRLMALGLQHVLVMYAGAVVVPLIVGSAMHLPKDQITFLINADLFACGIATLLQTIGMGPFGIRLPIMMGVTFASVPPMIAIGSDPNLGLLGIYGAVIIAGIVGIFIAPLVGKLFRFFPPVVTGTVIMVIGISLMGVGIHWAAGGLGNPHYGHPFYLLISTLVLLFILALNKFGKGFWVDISVLLGIIFGFVVTWLCGKITFPDLTQVASIGLILPFHFGLPTFNFWAIVTMIMVTLVTFIESSGMFLAVGDIVGRPVNTQALIRGLRVDGLGTLIGGVFNTFPYTSFSQNVGLVAVTGVRSRWVCAVGGVILLLLGLFPKIAHIVASVPVFVLGGAGIVMFGMVTATGIRILSRADLFANRANQYIIAVSVGVGMIPVVAPQFFVQLPPVLAPLLKSGILLATLSAVLLNILFNGLRSQAVAEEDVMVSGKTKDTLH
ncbi:MAG: purine permease [Neisseriales bacterium]|nr:MAG: purine permease [Neisseriales bacterium]